MQPPYKVEVYDRQMNFRSMAVIEAPEIYFDYLTLEGIKLTAPSVLAQKGDFAHVTDAYGSVVYQGIVADVARDKTVTLSLSPLLSLFDLTVTYNRVDLQTGALESFIAGIMSDLYITNSDTLQRIPMTIEVTSHITNTTLNIKSNVHEFYDIITKGFMMYGIVVDAVFWPQQKKIAVTIGKAIEGSIIIEAHLPNVLEKSIVIGDSYGQLNKITLINKYDEAERVTYYLHTNGSIDTNNIDRITPVFSAIEYVESEDFATEALARARESLSPQKYDNLIELTFSRSDMLINPASIPIGTAATIIDGLNVYDTIFTGYAHVSGLLTMVFGNVRIDLTKKLILERRSV